MASEGEGDTVAQELARLGHGKAVVLETRKRDGSWVATPVSLVVEGDRGFFRTYDASGKFKRLRNFPDVRLAPSTYRGKAKGPTVEGRARLLSGGEAEHARSLLAARYPWVHGRIVPWMHRRKGWTTEHYELTIAP